MSFKLPSIAPPRGVQLDQYVVTLRNASGGTVTKGEVVVLSLNTASSGDVNDNNQDMGLDSGFVNFVDVSETEASNGAGIYGILLEDITDDNLGKVCLSGVVDAITDGNSPNIAAGDALIADRASGLASLKGSTADADNAVLGVALAASTSAAAAGTTQSVLFNGFAINRA
jgi:hypothetical protein